MPRSTPMPKKERERLKAFGGALRAARNKMGLSQERFALQVGLDRTYVGGIERGERNPSLRNIWKLAEALGVSPSDLLIEAERFARKRKKTNP